MWSNMRSAAVQINRHLPEVGAVVSESKVAGAAAFAKFMTVLQAVADAPQPPTAAASARDFGVAHPRSAIAGSNPHAGEDGRMGHEDADVVAPAVAASRAAGIDARGPLPADTMFHAEARETYDAAICSYHDQASIPLKASDFDAGVNVTSGSPIVRTSPDHGTALAIAGTGTARAGATAFRMTDSPPQLPPLREVVNRHGSFASTASGQNFSFDEQLSDRIAKVPGNSRGANVSEVGPGPGGSTRASSRAGANVTAIEMDKRCSPALAESSDAFPGQLTVIEGDATRIDPVTSFDGPWHVAANSPYNVGTSSFTGWLSGQEWPPRWQSVTSVFRREVAERVGARAGTDAYGRLAVSAQWRARPVIAMKVHGS
ncbi:hypothetical protein OY671_007719, partial [Metschnikowia pulcherrima]